MERKERELPSLASRPYLLVAMVVVVIVNIDLCENVGVGNTTDPKELIKIAFNITNTKIGDKFKETNLLHEVEKDPRAKMALDTCKQLMDLSIGELTRSLDGIVVRLHIKILAWMGLRTSLVKLVEKMKDLLMTSMHMSSNALAIVSELADTVNNWNVTKSLGWRLLQDSELPSLLKANASPFKHKPNVTIAEDGSEYFTTINEALKQVPEKNRKSFLIYINKGVHQEYVEATKEMTHMVFIGDGGKKTRKTENKNFIGGINTYRNRYHFVVINMGFENSVGPQKHQAVALRVQADKCIFYNCSIDEYWDTLYIPSTLCLVIHLFVFQNSIFVVRKSLHCNCTSEIENKAYLARPWKNYSRTIIIETYINDLIHSYGYLPWQGLEDPSSINTCFYVEYHNTCLDSN
ncbi:putative pectinesterase/pectinesterase inhibitor 21 [Glycine soja]